ncbi:SDR family NAD(P)-dependent oxidoreductase [Lentzea sp. NBC_00516]|uniref:SDR family NAD(P)-dependent oxidoreductase n=1 Tax=Lentzea sp. NBC_00516 TaxID=2903582 RepID=UPI002E80A8F2|nr:SDR family NAD(P)-dependent oxidoreductase [Lentzea sp. NBC_00516]WUD27669.1 SDR family NAD(P)-dependent oxidoreductase [Lentzea sp. NBC_00516]
MTRSILSVPVWRAGQEVPPAPAGGRRLVVLCDLPAIDLPGVQTAEVTTGGDAPHIAYERAAVRLFGELKRLMSTSDGRPCVVQLACRADSLYRGLLGLLRTAAQEDPGLTVRLVEFTYEPSAADLVAALNGQGEHVRHTPAGRETVTWEPVARTTASPVWRDGGVYLISGGAGGIGRLLAEDVARHAPNAVVVRCGRSATADGPGEYHRVDVTDATAVHELVASIVRTHGQLDGILHAAALLRDDYLIRASYQDFLRVLAPKVTGLVHLDEASRDLPLDFFAAFSAAAGNLGNAGQAAYTAANGFLDAYAAHRQELVTRGERHGASVSLAWPLWRDGGMHVPDEELPALIERFGPPLPTEAALAALHGAVELGATHVVISGEGTVMTGTDDLRGRVLGRLKGLIAETMRLDPATLDATAPLDSHGIDSITVTRLNKHFARWFGALPKTVLYQYPTLAELAAHLTERHPEGCARWLDDVQAPAEAARSAEVTERPRPVPAGPRPDPAGEPIAIIGLSGRYPDAPTLDDFWANLRAGRDSIREVPAQRWALDGFFEPDQQKAVDTGASYSKWGGFLDGFARFDAGFFGISPREAADIDPQERLFLETVWSALEDAGYTRDRLATRHQGRVGVFAGVTKTGFDRNVPPPVSGPRRSPRTSFASLANRVSYLLDLRGPSLPVDTMCSASLTAIHEACEHLRQGTCEVAIAGGVNLYLHPSTYVDLCRSRMLAADGRCRSFGDGGEGFVPGEGVGAVLLKPLAAAEADGDPIHAVILGSAINHGGRTNGYTVPNPRAQAAVVREAIKAAGLRAGDIGYIEAHGTGTRLGDPVEIDGLTQAFEPDAAASCAIGSVKSNIGHLEAAAGIAGLTKVVLQLRNGEFAPTLHAERTNPNIDFAATPFELSRAGGTWPRPDGGRRIGGISSFGAGGANAHVIVAEHLSAAVRSTAQGTPELLPVSARTEDDLRARVAELAQWLDTQETPDLAAIAATLRTGREAMSERVCFVARDALEWRRQLRAFLAAPATDASGESWWRGRVEANNETLAELAAKPELRELIAHWLGNGGYAELASFWVRGTPIDWSEVDGASPRVHLPGYPFAGTEFWFEPAALQPEAAPVARPAAVNVESVLMAELAEILQMPVSEIERHRPFADYGLDSILGVSLVHRLNDVLGTAVDTTDLFDHGTAERFITFLAGARPSAAPVAATTSGRDDAIAVVGLAARYGDAEDPDALWAHLVSGTDLVEPVTRWPLPAAVACRTGSFLRDIDRFDPAFFGISGVEATAMDPQQRVFLEQCWNALEDAGYTGGRRRGTRAGVYVGCYAGDYSEHLGEDAPAQALWGTMGSVVASRIAYLLDFTGPALTVDTSCSSSLVAIDLACRDLLAGTADLAIAGGVFVQNTSRLYKSASVAGMLSASGRCRSFDAGADGFVPGEGAGAIVLKRLADAERDGDHIHAVVRASGVNQDGTTNGITAPSALSQERLLREVHGNLGVGGVQYVEAHGTGTQLGDPIEFRALSKVFADARPGSVALGSIKSNLGHTQFAAGVAGVVKAVLALRHRTIPATLHFTGANARIPLQGSAFTVPTKTVAWPEPEQGPRRAAVSSFGASGTNAHVVLEEYQRQPVAETAGEQPFLLSARSPEALREVAARLAAHLEREPGLSAAEVAYSLAAGRSPLPHRLAVVAASTAEAAQRLRAWLSGTATGVHHGEVAVDAAPRDGVLPSTAHELASAFVRENLAGLDTAFPAAVRRIVPLPTYPYQRQRYWPSRGASAYRTRLTGQEFFLADHHVNGRAVLPAVLSLEFARRAATSGAFEAVGIRDLVWAKPFPVGAEGADLAVERDGDGFRVCQGETEVHAHGRYVQPEQAETVALNAVRARCTARTLSAEQCRSALDAVGIAHGPRLRALESLAIGDREVLAKLVVPAGAQDEDLAIHPAVLDSAIQAVVGLFGGESGELAESSGRPALPFAVDRIDLLGPVSGTMWAHLRHTGGGSETSTVDIDVCDETGRVAVRLRGLAFRRVTAEPDLRTALLAPVWDAVPDGVELEPAIGSRLVLAGGGTAERAAFLARFPGAVVLGAEDHGSLPADAGHIVWLAPETGGTDGTFTVFRWIKALLAQGADGREIGFTAVTRQACRANDDETVDATHAGVHGLLGSVAKEYPHWQVRVVDIAAGAAVPFDAVLNPPAAARGGVAALRHGEWLLPRLVEVAADGPVVAPSAPRGVVVAIGGAGGIGEVWTEHLLRRHGTQVVWIGRRPLDAEITAKQDRLAAFGPRPGYLSCDASDVDDLRRACAEIVRKYGPVHGVLHTAIVLGDRSVARMDEELLRTTYAAKAGVTVALAEVFADQPLEFVVFFSSMQAFFTAPGQANYAAGCTFSDAYADGLSARLGCPVKVMNWGYWGNVGIVAEDGYRRRMARLGLGSIEPDEGMAAVDHLLGSSHDRLALLKAADSRSIATFYERSTLKALPHKNSSPAAALLAARPDRQAAIERVRVAADGHGRSMEPALVRITWALLRDLGLFGPGQSGTADDWMVTGGIVALYRRWLEHTLDVFVREGLLRDSGDGRYTAIDSRPVDLAAAWRRWDADRTPWLDNEGKRPQAVLVDTTLRALNDILTGRRPATDVMFPKSSLELVEAVYRNNPVADYFNDVLADTLVDHVRARVAENPDVRLRLLEIGAGTGGTSRVVFGRLAPWRDNIETYCYTDLSKAFLLHARRSFGDIAPYLDTRILNVEKSLAEQSLDVGGYDIVVATNVLHATRNIRTTLTNTKAAMRANGVLLLNELSDNVYFSHLTFGLLEGWWRYDDPALRIPGSPGLTPADWLRALSETGFRSAFVAAEGADDLGQQVFVACADDVVRQPIPAGGAAFPAGPENEPVSLPVVQAVPETVEPVAPAASAGREDELLERARDHFRALVADVLQLPVSSVRADVTFDKYGIDSILVVQLTEAVRRGLDDVGSTLFFEVRTIDGLAAHFVKTQPDALAALVGLPAAEQEVVAIPVAAPVVEPVAEPVAVPSGPARTDEEMPIAVIGISGRFPGARNLNEFWANLLDGVDSVTEIPSDRWNHDRYFDPRRGKPGRTYAKWGGFLDGVDEFDPLFFGISPGAASTMDPQERLFLQAAYETLQDAGHTRDSLRAAARAVVSEDAGDIGVFAGAMYTEYQLYGAEQGVRGEPVVVPGSLASIANRVSYFFDANGPSIAVDTMCAAALTAIHLACAALRRGECGVALAGGVNLSLHPSKYLMIGQTQFASSDGRCRSFGAGGDGYVPGEGVGAVLLRPLADAQADGDRILGVIRGTAVNHGGHTHGFTVPNPVAQASVIRQVYRRSGVDPRRIGYVEAHGTGTPLGDPIEIAGLTSAFSEFTDDRGFCAIGSVKSNIGHLEAAAGVAGLGKLLLQMRHGTFAPSLHSAEVNPEIDFSRTPFVLQREAAPWPRTGAHPRAGVVSAFGAGGSNAHLLVEEYIVPERPERAAEAQAVVLSATDHERLRESAERLRDELRDGAWSDADLPDIAYTLQVGREPMTARFATVVRDLPALVAALDAYATGAELPADTFVGNGDSPSGSLAALKDDEDFQETLARWAARRRLGPLAEAWVNQVRVDWSRLHADGPRPRKVGLPTYPFARERYWYTDVLPNGGATTESFAETVAAPPAIPAPPATVAPAVGQVPAITPVPAVGQVPAVTPVPVAGQVPPAAQIPAAATVPVVTAQPATVHHPRATADDVLPAGDLTLCPVWEVERPGDVQFSGRVLAIGLGTDDLAVLHQAVPDAITWDGFGPIPGDADHVVLSVPTRTGGTPAERVRDHRAAVQRLLHMVNAVQTRYAGRQLELTLLTRDAFGPSGGDPAQASLHGFIGALAKEQPHWRVRAVDLAKDTSWQPAEVFGLPGDRRAHPVVQAGGQWLRRRLVQADLPAPATSAIRRGGVYVLIGGAGDLGVVLTEHLARTHGARVVWVGRRAENDDLRSRKAGITGLEPLYLQADAGDPQALRRVRDEVVARYGRVDGIVHLAMTFTHTPITDLTDEELAATLASKVDPVVHLADAFSGVELDFVLLVSSLVSFIRNANQAHYAAACAYVDAAADGLRASLGCAVKTINWGYWGNVTEDLIEGMAAIGLAPIDPATAMAAVEALLAGPVDVAGFLRLGRPLPVEGVLTGEVAAVRPRAAVAPIRVQEPRLPVALAAYQDGPVPAEIDAALCRWVAAELRDAGFAGPSYLRADARFAAWVPPMLRALTEHGLVDAAGRWALTADSATCRAEWARSTSRWVEANSDLRTPLALLARTVPVLPQVLRGEVLATDVLFPNGSFDLVEGVYRDNRVADHFNAVLAEHVVEFLRARLAAEPGASLRLLEVGAGTGGTTRVVLDRLTREGLPVAEYCFTDISRAFLHRAEDSFGAAHKYLTYRLFDAALPPHGQALDLGAFDVVIAANVLHATKDVRATLRGTKALLRGGGLLALNEISGFYLVNHLTFGLLDGWWEHTDPELRVPGGPALSPASWQAVLEQEGFTGFVHAAACGEPLGQQVALAYSDGVSRGPGEVKEALVPAPAPAPVPVEVVQEKSIRAVVLEKLAGALRMTEAQIDPERAFADYGLDSIVGAGFVQQLNDSLDLDLLTTVIFDYRSVELLAAHIASEHQPVVPVAVQEAVTPQAIPEPPVAPVSPTTPAETVVVVPEQSSTDPIAIIGVSGRFAGSPDLDALWRHLADGDDLVGPIERWDTSGPEWTDVACREGGFLDGIDEFDAQFFRMSGREAAYTDPQQRLFVEEAWTALENAGYVGAALDGKRAGVYVGCTSGDYTSWFTERPPAQAAWGNAPSIVPARVAYHLNLHGPAIAVDTACSSSLVAIHLACQSLRDGETDLAVAGGVAVQTTPNTYLTAGHAGMLSPTGRCHTFDASADGFVPGEGVGVVVLKRLSDALADGDHVHAVIRGSGINQDGATNGITAPSAASQERLIREVYERFDVDPAEIGLMEAHGTGTKLGDPIETEALVRAFGAAEGSTGCALGSLKSNIGHTMSAAGVAGVLKIVLALRHGMLPPSLHHDETNPAIRLAGSPFRVHTELTPWEPNRWGKRVAATSSFGFSGTNGHLVVEEPPALAARQHDGRELLFPLSAPRPEALRQLVANLAGHLRETPELQLADVSHTLVHGRAQFVNRVAFTAADRRTLLSRLEDWLADGTSHPARDAMLDRVRAQWTEGGRLESEGLFTGLDVRRTPLPTYPFQRRSAWVNGSGPADRQPSVAKQANEPIAVVGLAARFADTPDAERLWAHLAAGDDLVGDVTRWDLDGKLGKRAGRQYGSFLDDPARFDALFFSVSGIEATYTDPQQRVFLEECWHALEDAGYAGERLTDRGCGVYVGAYPGDYHALIGDERPPQTMWGNMASVIASRISYLLDLSGPAVAVDSACSSSLVAIHLACDALRLGTVSMALAGGVFVQATPRLYEFSATAKMLSPTGRCRTFDAAADGMVPGEGAGVLVLKRLSDALRDGDHVYGVISASGVNQDGATNGITAPSAQAQEDLVRQVHRDAGVRPGGVQMIEAHGTGTPLGDPIEFGALAAAFTGAPEGGCALGSIKTNVGHTQFTAGVAGTIKALLSLHHRQVPPSLHFSRANPAIPLQGSPFHVPTELQEWSAPESGPRRAGVSSFGASGTNAHLVVEEAPEPGRLEHPAQDEWLVVVSAQDEATLRTHVERVIDHVDARPDLDLGNIAYSLATGRRHENLRLAVVAGDRDEWLGALRTWLRDGHAQSVVAGSVPDDAPATVGAEGLTLAEVADRFVRGEIASLGSLFGQGFRVVPLPGYPFGGERYWISTAPAPSQPAVAAQQPVVAQRPVVSARPVVPAQPAVSASAQSVAPTGPTSSALTVHKRGKSYAADLTGREFFLDQHRLSGTPVLPGVAYVELARAAAEAEGYDRTGVTLRNVVWIRPARIPSPTAAEVTLEPRDGGFSYQITTTVGGETLVHGQGRVEPSVQEARPTLNIAALRARCTRTKLDRAACYARYGGTEVHLGEAMRGVEKLEIGVNLIVARLRRPAGTGDGFTVHPSMLDSALQATHGLALAEGRDDVTAALPFALTEAQIHAPTPEEGWAVIRPSSNDLPGTVRRLDIDLCDDAGRVCVRLLGFTFREFGASEEKAQEPSGTDQRPGALVLGRPGWHPSATATETRQLVRHEVLFADVDPGDVADRLGVHGEVLPIADDLATTYTRRAEFLLTRLQDAAKASRDGWVLVQVVVPDGQEHQPLAGLAGLLRTARNECTRLLTQLVLVAPGTNAADLAERLRHEASTVDDVVTRVAGGHREVARWTSLGEARAERPWRDGGVYLITGGAGGLGAVFAREIASAVQNAVLVLCGRSAAGASQRALLDELRASGSHAEYRQLDVADRDAVDRCVQDIVASHGELSGVLHSAGVLRDSYFVRKTVAQLREVFAAKVTGFVHLDEATAGQDLDFFIGFSSLSSSGNPGQADYAAANAFLDGYAARRDALVASGKRRGRSLSVGWPLWTEGGMRVDAATEQAMWDTVGVLPMPTDVGVEALYRAWGSGEAHVLVIYGDRERIERTILTAPATPDKEVLSVPENEVLVRLLAERVATLLDVPVDDIEGEVELTEYGFDSISLVEYVGLLNDEFGLGLVPTLLIEYPTLDGFASYLRDAHGEAFGSAAPAPQPTPEPVVETAPEPAPITAAAPSHEALLGELIGMAAAVLRLPANRIEGSRELSRYGVDSLSLTELVAAVNRRFGLDLDPTILFEHPALSGFADFLLEHHADRVTVAEVQEEAPAPEPASTPAPDQAPVTTVTTREPAGQEPIAVIGMSGRFPQARDIAEFWQNLLDGRDCISEIPADRWDWRECFGDPVTEPNTSNVKWGGFIDGVGDFDPLFFDISPREAELMDPQQRLLLLYAWKALEDAGYSAESVEGTDTAIVIGTASTGYPSMVAKHSPAVDAYDTSGAAPCMGPNRMSYFLGVHGPSEPIDTACSSALIAVHRAVCAIQDGTSDMAIVGGVNTIVNKDLHISMNMAGMLAEDGRSKTFSIDADGYGRGEGVGMLVLKRLSAAERDGDHVYGLIRGTAENHGGRANSLTAPNPKAQAAVIRTAHRRAGIDPRTIGYVEAHGTGTRLGDPVEINGLKEAFRDLYADTGATEVAGPHCAIGSVKTNIGHLEVAAGIAGLIKVLLQMKHRTLVRNLNNDKTNPYVKLDGTPFYLLQDQRPWRAPVDGDGAELPRRAGISSFGFGGANAHVVLEEHRAKPVVETPPAQPVPVVLSASHPEVLRSLAEEWVEALNAHDDAALASIAYTTHVGRTPMAERLGCVAGTVAELQAGLRSWLRGEPDSTIITGRVSRDEIPAAPAGTSPAEVLRAWVRGAEVDWTRWHAESPRRIPLPTYPFRLKRYWIDTSTPVGEKASKLHPLVHVNTSDLAGPRYTTRFTGREFFLADHKVRGAAVLPGAAYLEMARAAAELAGGDRSWALTDVTWELPLTVKTATEVHIGLTVEASGGVSYRVFGSTGQGSPLVYGRGALRETSAEPLPSHDIDTLIGRCAGPVLEASECYERFARLDLAYGPAMRAIERVHSGERLAVARLRLPDAAAGGVFALHPSMLDAAFQSTLGLFASDDTTTAVPYAVGEVRVIAPLPTTAWAVTRFAAEGQSPGEQSFDIDVCDDDGRICVRLTGFRVRSLVGAPAVTTEPEDDFLARLIEAAGDGSLSLAEFERSLA